MKATYIDYKDTNSFSNTLLAYLSDHPSLAPFAGNRPTLDGFARQLEAKAGKTDRTELVRVLRRQYGSNLAEQSAVAAHINALADERTFTVTTGHQLNIFTGPLYFIFKIASTIRLAKDLKEAFPDYNFVPVYWMATEDHDFAEINHTRLHGKKIVWDTAAGGATGRMKTAGMDDTVHEYQRTLGLSDNSSKLAALVRKAYLQHSNLADATRSLVDGLFGAHGLVVIDADEVSLKQRFAPFIEQDILGGHSHDAIEETSAALQAAGFASQVHAREINFFYLTDTFRERIVKLGDGRFEVLNQGLYFSEDELRAEIHSHPERFSPNVVMRPLYQEVVLPNLAYIGGGAEIAYWLQLKSVFGHYGIDFPILVPRNSAMITDDNMSVKVLRLNLTFRSIFKDTDELKKEYVRRHTKHRLTLNDEWMELNAIFSKLRLRAHKIDPSLGPSTDAVKARLKKAINNLEKKLLKADKRNHEDALIQIDRIKEKLFPGGVLQERSENMGPLYVRYGDRLIEELIQHFSPLDFKFTIIY
ncbi:bacillithiol biosynthesis cysteine-adding enzyme BshC [Parapedobacter sp.]